MAEADPYQKATAVLDMLCDCTLGLSTRTQGRAVAWEHAEGSIIFAKLGLTCISLLRLVPESSFHLPTKGFIVWDTSSVASLVRNLIETYFAFYYLAVDQVPADERNARRILWHYHDSMERWKVLKTGIPASRRLAEASAPCDAFRIQLEANSFFQGLSQEQRARYLKGKSSTFVNREKLAERIGISKSLLGYHYKYCSNFTHTSPMSLSTLDAACADSPKGMHSFKFAIEIATPYMCMAIHDFTAIFPDQAAHLSGDVRSVITLWRQIVKWEANDCFEAPT